MASGLNKQSLREKANSSHLQMKIFKCLRDVKVEDSDHFWHFVVRDLVAAQKGNDRLPSARKTSLSNFQIYFYFSASFVPKNLNFLRLLHSSEMFFLWKCEELKKKINVGSCAMLSQRTWQWWWQVVKPLAADPMVKSLNPSRKWALDFFLG